MEHRTENSDITALNARIEKARAALLKIVGFWLAAAMVFSGQNDKALPPRLGRWIAGLLYKLEKTVYYLTDAAVSCQIKQHNGAMRDRKGLPLFMKCGKCHTLREVISRLTALQDHLHHLHANAARLAKIAARSAAKFVAILRLQRKFPPILLRTQF
ncbi:MAG: hypothetical protein U5K75_03620 [Ahrensia sp.]|nr:hypothetical protein [Ahrensia sp.]